MPPVDECYSTFSVVNYLRKLGIHTAHTMYQSEIEGNAHPSYSEMRVVEVLPSTWTQDIKKMINNPVLHDVELRDAGRSVFNAHSSLLALRSKYFRDLIGFRPQKMVQIDLDINSESMMAILEIIYTSITS